MDQEYLLRRYYEELGRASEDDSPVAKQAHEALARGFKDAADKLDAPKIIQFRSAPPA